MPFEDIEAFQKWLEAIEEHNDDESTIIQEANIFRQTDRQIFNEVNRSHYGKGTENIEKKLLEIKVEIVM